MTPAWWPPKVGDRLLYETVNEEGQHTATVHVVSVFEHEGNTIVVGAEWWKFRRRWNYEVFRESAAIVGLIRPLRY